MNLLVKGTSGPLTGAVQVPNSKYHAHRALILASLAPGTSRILGLSDARHVQYTMDVHVDYVLSMGSRRVVLLGDIFNFANLQQVLNYNPTYELSGHRLNPDYGAVTLVQDPRQVRIGARFEF